MEKKLVFVITMVALVVKVKRTNSCETTTVHLGCHQGGQDYTGAHANNRDIPELTVEKCIDWCSTGTNSYVLLLNGNYCYCSNTLPPKRFESSCDKMCAGDNTQRCGGPYWSDVYQVKCKETTTTPSTTTTTTTTPSTTTTSTTTMSPTRVTTTTISKVPTNINIATVKDIPPPSSTTTVSNTYQNTTTGNSASKKRGAIIGGATVAALLVIAGLIILIIFLIRKKKNKDQSIYENDALVNNFRNNEEDKVIYQNVVSESKDNQKNLPKVTIQQELAKKIKNTDPNKPGPSTMSPPVVTNPTDSDTSTEDPDEPLYANAKGGVLKINEIEDYIKKRKTEKPGLEEEYQALLQGQQSAWTVGGSQEVKIKNRFKNIYPYDKNRVLIEPTPKKPHSDYINASYIDGYKIKKRYIAAQGPKKPGKDFWQMLWEHNVKVVVMVTNLIELSKEKCTQYWPELDQSKSYGSVKVKNIQEKTSADTILRRLQVYKDESTTATYGNVSDHSREVLQFHFTEWPDKDVPDQTTSLINLVRKVRKHTQNTNSPIVVHCSAGIGRTGTFIALDYLIDQGGEEGKVDVFGCVNKLREQRVSMVQKKEQYVYLYECVCEALNVGETTISCDNFTKVLSNPATKSNMVTQYKFLKSYGQSLLKSRRLETAKLPENENKNRVAVNLPSDNTRVFLITYMSGKNDYINAVMAATYQSKRGLFLTQLPLSDTVVDFWRMVYDHKIDTIVMLSNYQDQEFKTSPYWPADTADKVKSGPFTISKSELTREGNIACCHLVLTYEDREKKIFLVGAVDWEATSWQPTSLNTLYDLYNSVKKWKSENTESGKTAIQCLDGNMNSGMYAVVSWMFDMINAEQEVDIYTITKHIMHAKPEFLTKHEQYRALHNIAGDYMQTINVYNNVTLT